MAPKRQKEIPQFLTMQAACKHFGIQSGTLRNWCDKGYIHFTKSPGGVRIFNREHLQEIFSGSDDSNASSPKTKHKIVYCRVSSNGQKDDLQRQVDCLRDQYPNHAIIQDIGSGINFRRRGLQTILEYAMRGDLEEVVVAFKDRLCRFGFDLVQSVIEMSGGKLIVLDDENHKSSEQELAEDLLSIVHVFNCRQMGKRKYTKRSQVTNLPDTNTKGDIQEDV